MIRARRPDGTSPNMKYFWGVAYEKTLSQERIDRIRELKRENPDANNRWIAVMAFDSELAVEKALKDYTPEEQLSCTG
jgi:hypothetical protein